MSDAFQIISDLRAEVAQLKAQLAETWQPVSDEDGERIACACGREGCDASFALDNDDGLLIVKRNGQSIEVYVGERRLCRKGAPSVAVVAEYTMPSIPLINWDAYPPEYKWFAIDPKWRGYVHAEQPCLRDHDWHDDRWDSIRVGRFDLNNISWKDTLTTPPTSRQKE